MRTMKAPQTNGVKAPSIQYERLTVFAAADTPETSRSVIQRTKVSISTALRKPVALRASNELERLKVLL